MNELIFLFMRVEFLLAFNLLMLTSGTLFCNPATALQISQGLISQISRKLEPNYSEK